VVRGREGQRAGLDLRGKRGEAFGHTAQMGPDQRHQHGTQQTMPRGDRLAQRLHEPGETLGGRRKRRRCFGHHERIEKRANEYGQASEFT
jgi:hypothetical protein